MPIITLNYEDLESLIGKKIDKKILLDKLSMIGASVERIEGNEIAVEIFPDRPDMLSVEGIARAMRNFLGIERGIKRYSVKLSNILINVEKNIKKIRPYIAGAVIKKVKLNDQAISSLMEMQEKLHFSIGKDRKKMAIGVHDLDKVKPPFIYKGIKPHEVKFIPLGKNMEMDLDEILEKHEKGRAYAHLVKKKEYYPIILDKNGNVLSFPPIINGQLTAVTEDTKNIFVEVTGIDLKAVIHAINIVSTSLAERGEKIEQVKIMNGENFITPDLTPQKNFLDLRYVEKIVGLKDEVKIFDALEKMGHEIKKEGNKIVVYSPAWRVDILHPIDLIEDIAIGYGYEKFEETLPTSMTFGSFYSYEKIHYTMVGLGFNEVLTLSLSSREKEFEKMNIKGNAVEIKNPISKEHSILRCSLIPSLLEILSKNKHNDLPQQIYEIGEIVYFDGKRAKQVTKLAGVKIDAKTGFTECKSIVEAILRNFGIGMKLKEKKHGSFIEGRCASIIYREKEIGYFGEIKPSVICNFELEYPIIAFEIDVHAFLEQK